MGTTETKKGDRAILLAAVLWGLFPVITTVTLSQIGPLTSLFFSGFFAVIFFAIWLTIKKLWHEFRRRELWRNLFPIVLINGILFYCLYFVGLRHTNPGNASLVALLETFFSYIFFTGIKKQYFEKRYIVGALCMLLGAGVVLIPKGEAFHWGDWLVMAAVGVSPFGNYFQQKARAVASSATILFMRTLLTLPVAGALAFVLGERISLGALSTVWPYLMFSGFVLFGITKILWIEGIYRIPVTKATALSSIEPLITLLFAYIVLHQNPSLWQFTAFIPLCFGLLLLTTTSGFKFLSARQNA